MTTIEEKKNKLILKLNQINHEMLSKEIGCYYPIDTYGFARSKRITTEEQIEELYIASQRYKFSLKRADDFHNSSIYDFSRFVDEYYWYYDDYLDGDQEHLKRHFSGVLNGLKARYVEIEDEIKEVFGDEEIVEIEGPYLEKNNEFPYVTNYIINMLEKEGFELYAKTKCEKERKERNEEPWDGSVNIILQNLVKRYFKVDIDLTGKVFESKMDFFTYLDKEYKDELFQLKPFDYPYRLALWRKKDLEILFDRKKGCIKKEMIDNLKKTAKLFSGDFMSIFDRTFTFKNRMSKRDILNVINSDQERYKWMEELAKGIPE